MTHTFKPGDRVRCVDVGQGNPGIEPGGEYTVSHYETFDYDAPMVRLIGSGRYYARRFVPADPAPKEPAVACWHYSRSEPETDRCRNCDQPLLAHGVVEPSPMAVQPTAFLPDDQPDDYAARREEIARRRNPFAVSGKGLHRVRVKVSADGWYRIDCPDAQDVTSWSFESAPDTSGIARAVARINAPFEPRIGVARWEP